MSKPATRPSTASLRSRTLEAKEYDPALPLLTLTLRSVTNLFPVDARDDVTRRSKYFDPTLPPYLPTVDAYLESLTSAANASQPLSPKSKKKKDGEVADATAPQQCQYLLSFPSLYSLTLPLPSVQSPSVPVVNYSPVIAVRDTDTNAVSTIEHRHREPIDSPADFLAMCHSTRALTVEVYQYFPPLASAATDKKKDEKKGTKKDAAASEVTTATPQYSTDSLTMIGKIRIPLQTLLEGATTIDGEYAVEMDARTLEQAKILRVMKSRASNNTSTSTSTDSGSGIVSSDSDNFRCSVSVSIELNQALTTIVDYQNSNTITISIDAFHQLPPLLAPVGVTNTGGVTAGRISSLSARPLAGSALTSPKSPKMKPAVKPANNDSDTSDTFTVIYPLPVNDTDRRIVWAEKSSLTVITDIVDESERSIQGVWAESKPSTNSSTNSDDFSEEKTAPTTRLITNQSQRQPLSESQSATLAIPSLASVSPSLGTQALSPVQLQSQSARPSFHYAFTKASYLLPQSIAALTAMIARDDFLPIQLTVTRSNTSGGEALCVSGVSLIDLKPLLVPGTTALTGYFAIHQLSSAVPLTGGTGASKGSGSGDDKKKGKPQSAAKGKSGDSDKAGGDSSSGVKCYDTFDECHSYVAATISLEKPLVPIQPTPTITDIAAIITNTDGGSDLQSIIQSQTMLHSMSVININQTEKLLSSATLQSLRGRLTAIANTINQHQLTKEQIVDNGFFLTFDSFLQPLIKELIQKRFSKSVGSDSGGSDMLEYDRLRNELMIDLKQEIQTILSPSTRARNDTSTGNDSGTGSESRATVTMKIESLLGLSHSAEMYGDVSLARYHYQSALILAQANHIDTGTTTESDSDSDNGSDRVSKALLVQCWYSYAAFSLRRRDTDTAEIALTNALKLDANHFPSLLLIATLLIDRRLLHTAKRYIDALRELPGHPLADCVLAQYDLLKEEDAMYSNDIRSCQSSLPFTAFEDYRTGTVMTGAVRNYSGFALLATHTVPLLGVRLALTFGLASNAKLWLEQIDPNIDAAQEAKTTDSDVDSGVGAYERFGSMLEYANYYVEQQHYDSALPFAHRVHQHLVHHTKQSATSELFYIYSKLSNIYYRAGQNDLAEHYVNQYVKLFLDSDGDSGIVLDGLIIDRLVRIYLYKQNKVAAVSLLVDTIAHCETSAKNTFSLFYLRLLLVEALYLSGKYREASEQLSLVTRIDSESAYLWGWTAAINGKLWKEQQSLRVRRQELEERLHRRNQRRSITVTRSPTNTGGGSGSGDGGEERVPVSLELESLLRTEAQHRDCTLEAYQRFHHHSTVIPLSPLPLSVSLTLELGLVFYDRQHYDEAHHCWSLAHTIELSLNDGVSGIASERLAWIDAVRSGAKVEGEEEARKIQALFRKVKRNKNVGGGGEERKEMIKPVKAAGKSLRSPLSSTLTVSETKVGRVD